MWKLKIYALGPRTYVTYNLKWCLNCLNSRNIFQTENKYISKLPLCWNGQWISFIISLLSTPTLYLAGLHYGSQACRQKFMSRLSCTLVITVIQEKAVPSPADSLMIPCEVHTKIFTESGYPNITDPSLYYTTNPFSSVELVPLWETPL